MSERAVSLNEIDVWADVWADASGYADPGAAVAWCVREPKGRPVQKARPAPVIKPMQAVPVAPTSIDDSRMGVGVTWDFEVCVALAVSALLRRGQPVSAPRPDEALPAFFARLLMALADVVVLAGGPAFRDQAFRDQHLRRHVGHCVAVGVLDLMTIGEASPLDYSEMGDEAQRMLRIRVDAGIQAVVGELASQFSPRDRSLPARVRRTIARITLLQHKPLRPR